jgi:HAD superfamily phosphoserine phosphatase-like hydrolase
MKRIFVSSTFEDLKEHRFATIKAIRQLGAVDISMEHFGARDERPKDECIRLIREETDVFVGIYAHRYGFIPEGEAISITESEYREAVRAGVPVLVYLVDDNHPWPPLLIDKQEAAEKLAAFKAELRKMKIVAKFGTPHELAAAIAADLGRHFSGAADPEPPIYGLLHEPSNQWVSPVRRNRWRYKVVVFDLDGTLLRGPAFDFSWEAIWEGLGFARGIQSELKREYRRRTNADSSKAARIKAYQAWCDSAVEYFKSRTLTRGQLRELSRVATLTNNCREALEHLRAEGLVLAIVSGGVNTFLEDLFPDFREYLDFVFINELVFANDERLEGVRATAYDFQGKADALELVCKRSGCSASETVFVGDHFNDEAIMLKAGRAIAYPPKDVIVRGVSHVAIEEDDLLKIVPHILVE